MYVQHPQNLLKSNRYFIFGFDVIRGILAQLNELLVVRGECCTSYVQSMCKVLIPSAVRGLDQPSHIYGACSSGQVKTYYQVHVILCSSYTILSLKLKQNIICIFLAWMFTVPSLLQLKRM